MVALEVAEPKLWQDLFLYSNQSWDQFDDDDANTEPSWFKREESERQTQAAQEICGGLKEDSNTSNDMSGLKEGSCALLRLNAGVPAGDGVSELRF